MCFFFFKQKTAYDVRISDWSSDVCSSDLLITAAQAFEDLPPWCSETRNSTGEVAFARALREHDASRRAGNMLQFLAERSDESRVGKECVRTCRSRWSQYH